MMKERLKQIRNHAGYSQKSFANQLGIGYRTYCRYENDGKDIKLTVLSKLADMGYNITWLVSGEGEMMSGGSDYITYRNRIPEGLTAEDIAEYRSLVKQNKRILKEKDRVDQKLYKLAQTLDHLDEEERDIMITSFLNILSTKTS